MKRIILFFIIGAILVSSAFAFVSCTDGEEEIEHNPVIDTGDNDEGEWDPDNEDYSYTPDYELGGIPLG